MLVVLVRRECTEGTVVFGIVGGPFGRFVCSFGRPFHCTVRCRSLCVRRCCWSFVVADTVLVVGVGVVVVVGGGVDVGVGVVVVGGGGGGGGGGVDSLCSSLPPPSSLLLFV